MGTNQFMDLRNNQMDFGLSLLTHNFQVDKVAHHRLRGHLTFVQALISLLDPLDLQGPVPRVLVVRRLKPLVGSVRVGAHCEDVDVPVAYPGDLFG